jgi:hypothetical protein
MRKLIATIALLALVDTSAAIAQTVGSRNPPHHLHRRARTSNCCRRHRSATASRVPIKCPRRRTRWIRAIQSIERMPRSTA